MSISANAEPFIHKKSALVPSEVVGGYYQKSPTTSFHMLAEALPLTLATPTDTVSKIVSNWDITDASPGAVQTAPPLASRLRANSSPAVRGVGGRLTLYYSTLKKINACSNSFWVSRCPDCGEEWNSRTFVNACSIPYCKKCFDYRVNRNYQEFLMYGIESNRLFHFVIGFPLFDSLPTVEDLKEHKRQINRFLANCRRKGFNFKGFEVFDLVYHFDTKQTYVHYHFAVLPMRGMMTAAVDLQKIAARSGSFVLHLIGYKSKGSLFYYLSKRRAGVFGHENKDGVYGYSDFCELEDYLSRFHGVKKFSVLGGLKKTLNKTDIFLTAYKQKFGRDFFDANPDRIGSNIRAIINNVCPHCGSCNVIHTKVDPIGSVYEPPPNSESVDFEKMMWSGSERDVSFSGVVGYALEPWGYAPVFGTVKKTVVDWVLVER